MKLHRKKWVITTVVILGVLVIAIPIIIFLIAKNFTAQETVVRSDWTIETGDIIEQNDEWGIQYAEAILGDGIRAYQLVPVDISEDGFTYYDADVQERLAYALEDLKSGNMSWTTETPLAILNPYGTGSNGLYLYFETDQETQVRYTIHVEDERVSDYTVTAVDASGEQYVNAHEIQIIGLVPGMTNEVTLELVGSWGNVREIVHFTVEMAAPQSGYDVFLETTEGDSDEALSDGLFTMTRVNGYLGYGFFYDNTGVMRYEMVLEGYGMDRLLQDGSDIITSVSAQKIARINGLGQVERVYELEGYLQHHDLQFGQDGEVLVLAEEEGSKNVEDLLLSVNMENGTVTELVDFKAVLPDYYSMTREIRATDDMFWQAGEQDWIHLNSLQYMEENDSLIVSSRETSTIIKLEHIHSDVSLAWMAGDEYFWEDTSYAEFCLMQENDFIPQYGQHSVEYLYAGEEDGVYYLSVYNNNYWSLNSRDGYIAELDDTVGTAMYGEGKEVSKVYVYCVDENKNTYSLAESFEVPYSSFVSNVSRNKENGHWVTNSGVSKVFGEYDTEGKLIREYAYECSIQNYRTFKYTFNGFWFQ